MDSDVPTIRPTQSSTLARTLVRPNELVAREATYAPNSVLPEHNHPYAVLVLVLEGDFTERCSRVVDRRTPFALRIMSRGEPHENLYGPIGARCFLVEIHSALLVRLAGAGGALDETRHCQSNSIPATIVAGMHREFSVGDSLSLLAIEGLLCELVTVMGRASRADKCARPPVWLSAVRSRLDDAFPNSPSLLTLADAVGVHPTHLARAFRRYYGCSPAQHVAHRRITWAKQALAHRDCAISTVALEAGFADQAHFTNRFRSLTGVTPARYRNAHRRL